MQSPQPSRLATDSELDAYVRRAVDKLDIEFILCSPQGEIIYANERAKREIAAFLGEFVSNVTLWHDINATSSLWRNIQAVLATGVAFGLTANETDRATQQTSRVSASIKPIYEGSEIVYLAITFADVPLRKHRLREIVMEFWLYVISAHGLLRIVAPLIAVLVSSYTIFKMYEATTDVIRPIAIRVQRNMSEFAKYAEKNGGIDNLDYRNLGSARTLDAPSRAAVVLWYDVLKDGCSLAERSVLLFTSLGERVVISSANITGFPQVTGRHVVPVSVMIPDTVLSDDNEVHVFDSYICGSGEAQTYEFPFERVHTDRVLQ